MPSQVEVKLFLFPGTLLERCLVLFGESRRLDLIFQFFNNLCVFREHSTYASNCGL